MFRSPTPIRPFCCCLCLIIALLIANFCLSAAADGLMSREGLLGIEKEQLQLFDWKRRVRSIGGPSTGSDSDSDSSSSSSSSEEAPEGSGQEEREESESPSSPTPPKGSLQQSAIDRGEGTTESPEATMENSATEQRQRMGEKEEEAKAEGGGETEGSGEQ
ncbi:hypothetical protein GPALN_005598 [Globodera pallida]|nr:hypothetical protein GPALN_005598 [Globodera pallida]